MSEILNFQSSLLLRHGNMKQLVAKLQEQNFIKTDLIVNAKNIRMDDEGKIIISGKADKDLQKLLKGIKLTTKKELIVEPFKTAHAQFQERLDVPSKYYQKMLAGHLPLLKENINYWLDQSGKNYMLRLFENQSNNTGYLRAVLSDKYFTLDNFDVMMSALDAIKKTGANLEIDSCDISEQRMYVRFVAPNIGVDAPKILKNYRLPDGSLPNNPRICTGFVIRNSEIGSGKFYIAPRIMILACRNGMIREDEGFGKTHLGERQEENSVIQWSVATQNAHIELIQKQIGDAVKFFCSKDYLNKVVAEYEAKGSVKLKHPIQAVTGMSQHYKLSDERTQSILDYFIKSGEPTVFNAVQALTYAAQKDVDADTQYDYEVASSGALDVVTKFDLPAPSKN